MNLITRLRVYLIRRKAKRLEEQVIKEQNFVLYCPACKAVLNEVQEPVEVGLGFYRYTCPKCTADTTFDMSYPTPMIAIDPLDLLHQQIDDLTH